MEPIHGTGIDVDPMETDRADARQVVGDAYFSADVETDGPIPGPFSMLSFAFVYAGAFDGSRFERPENYERSFYRELKPISDDFQEEALRINGLDRHRLCLEGMSPTQAMTEASEWVKTMSGSAKPVL